MPEHACMLCILCRVCILLTMCCSVVSRRRKHVFFCILCVETEKFTRWRNFFSSKKRRTKRDFHVNINFSMLTQLQVEFCYIVVDPGWCWQTELIFCKGAVKSGLFHALFGWSLERSSFSDFYISFCATSGKMDFHKYFSPLL